MSYTSLTWTNDVVTSPAGPINGTRLQHMNDGIANVDSRVTSLEGAHLHYEGTWASGSYTKGAIVVHEGGTWIASADADETPGTESPWLLIGLTSDALGALTDVDDEDKADGKVLTYISDTSQWEARTPATGVEGDLTGDIGLQPGDDGGAFKIHMRGFDDDGSWITWDDNGVEGGLDGVLIKGYVGGRLGHDDGSGGFTEDLRWIADGVHVTKLVADTLEVGGETDFDADVHITGDLTVGGNMPRSASDFLTFFSRGTWASESSYVVGDYVKGSDAAGYVAIKASTDNDPTNEGSIYWAVVSQSAPILLRATDASQTNPGSAQTPAAAGSIMLFAVGGAFQLWKKDDGRDFAWSQALVAGTHLQVSNGLIFAEDNDGTLDSLAFPKDESVFLTGNGTWAAPVGRGIVTTNTGSYDMGDIEQDTVFFYSDTGMLTLPTAADAGAFKITVKNVGTGIITVAGRAADTVDGLANKVLDTQNQSVDLISNGTDGWWIV